MNNSLAPLPALETILYKDPEASIKTMQRGLVLDIFPFDSFTSENYAVKREPQDGFLLVVDEPELLRPILKGELHRGVDVVGLTLRFGQIDAWGIDLVNIDDIPQEERPRWEEEAQTRRMEQAWARAKERE